MTSEIEPRQDTAIGPYNPATDDWNTLAEQAHTVFGYDLISGEDNEALLDALTGVPFMILRLTYRPADMTLPAELRESAHPAWQAVKWERDYVSCEIRIAPEDVITRRARRGLDLTKLPFDPDEHLVFNDGSTGIRRQVTEYLAITDAIRLPDPLHRTGRSGECSYDLPASTWTDTSDAVSIRIDNDGGTVAVADVRIFCPRGLRISDGYSNEFTKSGKTRYLA
jgi:hypothetical protein